MNAEIELFANIGAWEYGCCGDVPSPDVTIENATLRASPVAAGDDGRIETRPYVWDRDYELLRFDGFAAHWWTDEDPRDHDIMLWLSWHDYGSEPSLLPTVTATVIGDVEAHRRTSIVGADGKLHEVPGSRRTETTSSLDRYGVQGYPESGEVVGSTLDEATSVTVRLTVHSATEPTSDDLAAVRADREKASRTVRLTGPATVFGSTVPADHGGRVSVDVDDSRLEFSDRRPDGLSGVVHGTAAQVGMSVTSGSFTTFPRVAAGTDSETLDHPLFVVLEVDRECFDRAEDR